MAEAIKFVEQKRQHTQRRLQEVITQVKIAEDKELASFMDHLLYEVDQLYCQI